MSENNDISDSDLLFKNKKVSKDVKRKVLAEKRAHELVEKLLEEDVSEEFFMKSVYFLSKQHYQDVNEERSIINLCGYPLCCNPLKNVVKQQYRISSNRVYDLSQRKLFCSDRCYKASDHVMKQVLTSPLWLRDPDRIELVSLDASGTGSKGEEVPLYPDLSSSSTDHDNKKDSSESSDSDQDEIECKDNLSRIQENSPPVFPEPLPPSTPSAPKIAAMKTPIRIKQGKKSTNPVNDVINTLQQWLNDKTLRYLGLIKEDNQVDKNETSMDELRKMKKLKQLEMNLNKIVLGSETSDEKRDDDVDFYTQRVEMFYSGRVSEKELARLKQVKEEVEEERSDNPTPIYPRIDSRNQVSIRRDILHQKLAKVCQDILPHLPPIVLARDIKELINTFSLTNNNVVLKTKEYPLMCMIIMILISQRNEEVLRCFNQSEALLNHVLAAYQLKLSTLKEKTHKIIDALLESR